ncbi:MAG TPA: SdrD B-like domain-containing protein, partial [Methanothrix sp.]|nr:SdrD B-like domain-containing protein [Methanothrix sp.]
NVTDACINVTLVCDNAVGRNFTNTPLLCIEGYKINDCNDSGIPGWTVILNNGTGEVDRKSTDGTGKYSFCGLEPGNYWVCEDMKSGWTNVTDACINVTLVCDNAVGRNFTNTPLLCIEGYKINDCNDSGIPGWTVILNNGTGEVDRKSTDGTGKYSFCGLEPGNYWVCEEMKSGWTNVTDACINVTLVCDNAVGRNFTNTPLLCIEGYKINDCNDSGIPGWTVILNNATGEVDRTSTNATGKYSFCGLAPGDYWVCEEMKADWTNVTETCINVTLVCDNVVGQNFTNTPLLCIEGYKINDCNDSGIPGWTVILNNGTGEVDRKSTDGTGKYSFCGLEPGNYWVCEDMKSGWTNVTETCINVTLVFDNVVGLNFTNTPLLCIEGYKINDRNDSGISGWTIVLSNATGEVDRKLTDGTGKYSFCGLAPGDYRVCEDMKAGWKNVTETCINVTLVCDNVVGLNFTNTPLLCIEGYKINDCNDSGIPGWTVILNNGTGEVDRKSTDGTGKYSFCGLEPGDYWVCEDMKAGWKNVTGTCINVTLVFDNVVGLNFTNTPLLCIEGYKIEAFNGTGIPGWTVILSNGTGEVDRKSTDGTGKYSFCGLNPGDYWVCEDMKAGWKNVTPTCINVTLVCDNVVGQNFTNTNRSCLGGNKTDDKGVKLPGWTIEVYINGTATRVGENVTNANGEWLVCNLLQGVYDVKEFLKPGWEPLDPADGWHRGVKLGANETKLGINFKNNFTAVHCIEGHKYDHSNHKPLSGWNITVTNKTGWVVGTNKTDENGYWKICGLIPGEEYTVCEEVQDGWTAIDPPDGCHHNVTVVPGQNLTLDFENDPRNITITKVADKYEVKGGEEVTYTITVCNNGGKPVHNVTVWDVFDKRVDILWVSHALGPDGKWHFDVIPNGTCVTITIKVKVPERQDFEFGMEQGVSGEGFVNVANDYSTTFKEYLIKNCAYVTSDWNGEPISACATVTVGEELGTELQTREYGSGYFDSEERVQIYTENKSIEWEEDVSATYKPTTIGLYNNRTVTYDSAWVKKARAKNRITGTTMTETYHDAVWLDRDSRMFLDKNESVMEVDSQFDGRGHVGFLKMPSSSSTPQATPIFEAREDYTGSFKVLERIDEYGSAVSSEKAASGEGLVVVDKRVGDSQRSYESGTGTYDSEEIIETNTNYIAKDISLVHSPMNQSLTDDVSIDASMKWKEGMYSKTPETSFIGEEYTSITELDKETVALGLNEMDTEVNFSGRARFRAILEDEVDVDDQYEGDYSLERRILFTGVPKYDRPHLTVTKKLENITDETIYGAKETTLVGESRNKVIKVATYTIRIENDGNKALGPIYVRDLFPPGSIFINASARPSELTETYANWTLTHLAIGDVSTITLNLEVPTYYPDELVNRVEVCGGYNGDEWICASNFTALEKVWLTCCSNETVSVTKVPELDEENPNVVWYRVDIKNWDDVTRVATVTDNLPEGMVLLDSMVPFASYEKNTVIWNLVEIGPFETATIAYRVEAQHPGRFVNSVKVDPRTVDGPVVQPVYANSVIDVGEVEECGATSCNVWSPPNWDFEYVGYPAELSCEELACDENCGLAP